jgi:antitoxin HicB
MQTLQEYLQEPYARIVIPTEPSGFHAELLEFFGCFAQGETVGEAYKNLERAAEAWIENALAQGHEIPEPSSAIDYSGRIVLRLPQGIHQQAARLAERDQTSLNTYLVSAVSAKVGADSFYGMLAQRFEQHVAQTLQAASMCYFNYVQSTGKTRTRKHYRIEQTCGTSSAHPVVKK